MADLLDPLPLGPKVARNRVVFGPHETNLARRRAISDRHVAYYRRRAAGGAGLVVVEEASVHPSDWPYERCPLAADAGPGWAAVAGACQAEGALVVAALGHSGGQGSSAYSQAPLWAPSPVPEVNSREVPKAMEAAEVAAVVAGFADAARAAVAAGCDGIEVNAGQHSLVRQFLSGLTNHRGDAWGVDRLLFARQVLEAVRGAAGPGAVLGLRLSCDELAPWAGLTPEAAAGVAAELGAMVDYLTVVRGSIYTVSATRPDGHAEPGFNLALTRAIRAAVPQGTAVVAQGSIVDLAMAGGAVADGTCDAVEMTRAQIADADLVGKVARGEPVRPCILCNQACMARDVRNPIVSCVVEPTSGHEWEDPPVPVVVLSPHGVRAPAVDVPAGAAGGAPPQDAGPPTSEPARGADRLPVPGDGWDGSGSDRDHVGALDGGIECGGARGALEPTSRRGPDAAPVRRGPPSAGAGGAAALAPPPSGQDVLVVGGGVAGLEAARVAAAVGHRVTLIEATDRLGGILRTAALGAGRGRLALAADWLEAEVRRLGVDVRLEREITADEVDAFPGSAILCTGSLPGRRTYRVEDGATVLTAAEALDGADLPGGAVLVWDPIGGPIGISVAERLRAEGREVTLVTPDLIAGNELSRSGDLAPANVRLQASGITIERRTLLRAVAAGVAQFEHRFTGEPRTLAAAVVVDAGYRLPDDRLWRATGERLPRAGDAVAPRTVYEAVLEGRRAALALGARSGTVTLAVGGHP
jgi:2,4-dienoyl-CoA reductase-like NADH-dependent reductase (Old Yellow Enzyme family)